MKKKTIITLSIVVLILLVTLGASVAIFSYLSKGTIESSIEVGDLTFHYTEIDGVGNGINIEDAYPISDEEGKVLNNYFDFKIDANLIQSDLLYEAVVEEIEGSNLPLDIVKFYLTEIVDGEEVELSTNKNNQGEIKTLSEYLDTTRDNIDGKTVYEERILSNTRNYKKVFRVRMWIKDGVDFTNYLNTTGSFRINVYANTNRSLVDASIPAPVITGGTGENWVSEAQTIKLSSSTPVLGGVAGYEYYITEDSEEIPDENTIVTGTLTVNNTDLLINEEGTRNIYYRTLALNGKRSAWGNGEVVKLDTVIPNPPTITASDGIISNSWHNSSFSLIASGGNNISGNTYYYGISTEPTNTNSTIIDNTEETAYYVRTCSGSGLCSSDSIYIVKLDQTAPTVPTITGGSGANTLVYVAPTITISNFSQALSGIKEYEFYKVQSSNEPTEETDSNGTTSNSLKVSDEGLNYVYYRAVSNSGLKSAWTTAQIVNLKTIWNYSYNGTTGTNGSIQTFTAPIAGKYKLEVWGAQGTYYGGYGGYSVGQVSLTLNKSLYIGVGGQSNHTLDSVCTNHKCTGGYNGGGGSTDANNEKWGTGGGATHIATTNRGILSNYNSYRSEVLIVAGGGGGTYSIYNGGSGGGYQGGIGQARSGFTTATGGTQSAAGANGTAIGGFGYGGTATGGNTAGGGSGWFGGAGTLGISGAGGSGYINNSSLSNKHMYCYNCGTTQTNSTYATTVGTCYDSTAKSDCAKVGHGYAKITYLGD